MPRKALLYSFIDRYAGLVVTLTTSMVLARLLTPEEIGVFSVTLVFLGIVATVRDVGAGHYIIREPNLTQDGVSATRTIQLVIGCTLAILTILLAKPVAAFYEAAEIESIMYVLSANFVVIPMGSVIIALWTRELQFQKLALVRFFGSIIGSALGIYLAFAGYGSISLAWAALATQLASVLACYFLWKGRYSLFPGTKELKRVLSFGSQITLYSIIQSIINGVPEMILARLQGMAATGLLSRGHGLVMLFDRLVMDAIGSVVFPVFSKTLREGNDLGEVYSRALIMVTVLGWTFFAVLVVTAFPVIRILFGDQWDGAVTITQILALTFAIQLPLKLTQTVLITKGATRIVVQTSFTTLVVTVVCCLAGANHGLHELGWGLVVASLINLSIWMRIAHKEVNFSVSSLLYFAAVNAGIAGVGTLPFLGAVALRPFAGSIEDIPWLIGSGLASLMLLALILRKIGHPIQSEVEIVYATAAKKFRKLIN